MDCSALYRTLVVGGAMLTGACAPKQAPVSEGPPTPNTGTTEEACIQHFDRRNLEPEPVTGTETSDPGIDEGELACEEICDGPPGRGRNCPDPELDLQNCCWLMANPHPCCDE